MFSTTVLMVYAEEPTPAYVEDTNLEVQELKMTESKPTALPTNSAYKLLDVKNEFPESLKVIFEANDTNSKELYLNAYETSKGIVISSTAKYKVQVYDLLGQYKGYIRDADTVSATILQVSPFLLAQEYNPPAVTDDPLVQKLEQPKLEFNANQVENLPELGTVLPKHSVEDIMFAIQNMDLGGQMPTPKVIETKPVAEPTPIEKPSGDRMLNTSMLTPYREYKIKKADVAVKKESAAQAVTVPVQAVAQTLVAESLTPVTKPVVTTPVESVKPAVVEQAEAPATSELSKRKLKIANLTAETLRVNISKDDRYIKEQGWTINGDDYSPQYLKLDNKVLEIDSTTNLFITDSKSNTTIKKISGDLNVDERGNYIFVIENLK